MNFLAALISSFLITSIFTLSTTSVFNSTLLNPNYLKKQAEKTHLYDDLAQTLPAQLSGMTGGDEKQNAKDAEKIRQALTTVLTPNYLQTKLGGFLDDAHAHYTQNGPAPEINLQDFAKQAQAAGIQIPEDQFTKPFTIPDHIDSQIKLNFQREQKVRYGSYAATVILLFLLFLICVKTHSYWKLASVFFVSALLQLILYFAFSQGPIRLFEKIKPDNASSQALVAIAQKFVTSVTQDMSQKFGFVALAFLVVALIISGLSFVSAARHRLPVKQKTA